jgi:hypothetical protein
MTPKEKAKELIDKYDFIYVPNYLSMFEVKQCALVAVDEILNVLFQHHKIDYWKQVKQEIEKL